MCYERHLRPRQQPDESREMWREFDRTQPVNSREPAPEATEPEPAELREAVANPGAVARHFSEGRGFEMPRCD